MALEVVVYSGSGYRAVLSDSSIYGVREGSALGMPQATVVFAEAWGRGYHPPAGYSYGNRLARLVHHIKGTSLDNWIVQYRQLAQILLDAREYWSTNGERGARAWLSSQLNGMTNATVWEILDGVTSADALYRYAMTVTTNPQYIDVPTDLVLKPFGHPQLLTRTTSGTLNNGGGTGAADGAYTLTAPAGEVPAPARVTVQPSAGQQRILLARKSRGRVSNLAWPIQCESTGGSGYAITNLSGTLTYADTAEAAASGGSVNRITIPSGTTLTDHAILQVTLNDNIEDWFGTYRVFLRVHTGINSATAWSSLQLQYGGASGNDITVSALSSPSNSDDTLLDLGRMTIPHRAGPAGRTLGSFAFRIRGSRVSEGSNRTTDWDCIYLLPVDEEFYDIQFSAVGAASDQLVSDNLLPLPMAYLLESDGDLRSELLTLNAHTRFTIPPGVDSRWFPLLSRTSGLNNGGHNLGDTLTLSFDYHPLYSLVR